MDAKVDFRTEFTRSHFFQLQKTAESLDLSFASLFEQVLVSYLSSETTPLSPFPRDTVAYQKEQRLQRGLRGYTTALRPSQIALLKQIAKAQKRPPKHVIEDAIAQFFNETVQIEMNLPGIESTEFESKTSEGVLSRFKKRIQTRPPSRSKRD